MRTSKNFIKLSKLLEKEYFTAEEARKSDVSSALLSHYIKSGKLKRLSRGIYQSSDFRREIDKSGVSQWDDLIETVYSIPGGVICLISALSIYKITDEIPRQFWIAVSNRTSIHRDRIVKIVRLRNMQLGKTEMDLEGHLVPIFDKERTIVDSFRLLGIEIGVKALRAALPLKGVRKLDLLKLQDYAKELRFNITPYLTTLTA